VNILESYDVHSILVINILKIHANEEFPDQTAAMAGEVARELGVCSQTIRRLADDGAVEVIRDAKGLRRFRPEAIEVLRRKLGLEAPEEDGTHYAADTI